MPVMCPQNGDVLMAFMPVFAGALSASSVLFWEVLAVWPPYIPLNTGEQTVVLLPRSPSPSKRYFPIPLDSLEDEYRIRSADDGKLFREEFNVSMSLCGVHRYLPCKPRARAKGSNDTSLCTRGFILISWQVGSFFVVAAVLLPPRVLWGGEQRAQQREKQISQHFTMWVRIYRLQQTTLMQPLDLEWYWSLNLKKRWCWPFFFSLPQMIILEWC